MKKPKRAYGPGPGHRFSRGNPVCYHCGETSETPAIRTRCPRGYFFDYSQKQGVIDFVRLQRLA